MVAKKGVRPTSDPAGPGPTRRGFLKGALAAGAVAAASLGLPDRAEAQAAESVDESLLHPHGVGVSEFGRIYVADSGHYRIAVFRGDDFRLSRTFGTPGFGRGRLNYPVGIEVKRLLNADMVLVADSNNSRICGFFYDGRQVREMDPIGSLGGSPGLFYTPQGVRFGPRGAILVANTRGHNIQRWTIDPDPTVDAVWGIMGDDGGDVAEGDNDYAFRLPTDLCVLADGRVAVLDSKHGRVVLLTATGGWAGSFGASGSGDGAMNTPQALTRAGDVLYVADTGNGRVVKWTTDGTYRGEFAEGFSAPTGVAYDKRRDRLVVADRMLTHLAAIPVF